VNFELVVVPALGGGVQRSAGNEGDITSDESNAALDMYLRELAAVPPLTKDEENALLQQVRTYGEHAQAPMQRLIEANLALVVSIADQHRPAGIDMLDLYMLDVIQEGNIALYTAVKTFHESGSDKFSEYAAQCIEKAISDAVSSR